MLHSPTTKYPAALRVLHWLMAVVIIGLIAIGLYMTSLPKNDSSRALFYSLHKSFGVTMLLLCIIRLGLRLRMGTPALPDSIPAHEHRMAHAGHIALYGCMILMPLSGYCMTNSFGFPVRWFGLNLPVFFGTDKARATFMAESHSLIAYTLIALVLLHIAGVIKHMLKERVNLLARMM